MTGGVSVKHFGQVVLESTHCVGLEITNDWAAGITLNTCSGTRDQLAAPACSTAVLPLNSPGSQKDSILNMCLLK